MKKTDKDLFGQKLTQLYAVMHDRMVVPIEKVKHINREFVFHDFKFQTSLRTWTPYLFDHRAYMFYDNNKTVLANEDYAFHKDRKNKFELFGHIWKHNDFRWRLFGRWSGIDMDDLLMKLDLKIVELV